MWCLTELFYDHARGFPQGQFGVKGVQIEVKQVQLRFFSQRAGLVIISLVY